MYICPICKGDRTAYLTCEYPACPDGRDQWVMPDAPMLPPQVPQRGMTRLEGLAFCITIWLGILALLLLRH